MARLTVERVSKSLGGTRVLDDLSLAVDDGELVALLGPSGCGKTTLLRLVAGFIKADAGRILIGDDVVSSPERHVPPERRRIGIVFQSYALWPHMTVAENVAYGLTVTGIKEPERSRRVAAALSLVDLDGYSERPPALLSGGQRQRVALARCLVTEPSLVLLDEPLANLDVHLRAAMEREFARFHERTRTTMIYVTHDQSEAMALADRIAVMSEGRILQVATPSRLYREPASETVASFIGEGMIVPVEVRSVAAAGAKAADIATGEAPQHCAADLFGLELLLRCAPSTRPGRARACLRPQGIRVVAAGRGDALPARIVALVYKGGRYRVELRLDADPGTPMYLEAPEPVGVAVGDAVGIAVDDGWVIPDGDRR